MKKIVTVTVAAGLVIGMMAWHARAGTEDAADRALAAFAAMQPAPGATVSVTFTKDARPSANGGELTEVSGAVAYFSESWICIQTPETGAKHWIPVRSISEIVQSTGARTTR